ncbi:MAG TPA: hypothetical protein VK586_15805 [Streptosporangiaceae bacterium]|nr:hypothetical protein [Streptosporangiaceae bacterium]
MINVVTVTPRPHEVALARVPAGTALRFPLRPGFTDDVRATDEVTYAEVPGTALAFWGVDLTTRYSAHSIGLGRHRRDRAVWQKAARMLAGDREAFAAVYVLLEEIRPYGRPVWLAVSIREEAPADAPDPIDGEGSDLD